MRPKIKKNPKKSKISKNFFLRNKQNCESENKKNQRKQENFKKNFFSGKIPENLGKIPENPGIFPEISGKIPENPENLGKIPESLGKIPENLGKRTF